jgi:hypothetical protein
VNTIKSLLKETLRETIREEILKIYILTAPKISKKEMQDIEKLYGSKPVLDKADLVDGTEWLGN